MKHGFFITGTDTEVGKTCVSVALLRAFADRGYSVAGMKPIASGCLTTEAGLRNDDAVKLQTASTVQFEYTDINPYAFEPPVAPHLAAETVSQPIEIPEIGKRFCLLAGAVDVVVVEGVGGWMVPLDDELSTADLAAALDLPVILVVGIRLGCINHALLTASVIAARGLSLAGWVANRLAPGDRWQDGNVATLRARLEAPLLADFDFGPEPDSGRLYERLRVDELVG